jgi:hypothetical protein
MHFFHTVQEFLQPQFTEFAFFHYSCRKGVEILQPQVARHGKGRPWQAWLAGGWQVAGQQARQAWQIGRCLADGRPGRPGRPRMDMTLSF